MDDDAKAPTVDCTVCKNYKPPYSFKNYPGSNRHSGGNVTTQITTGLTTMGTVIREEKGDAIEKFKLDGIQVSVDHRRETQPAVPGEFSSSLPATPNEEAARDLESASMDRTRRLDPR